jgi:sugar lactone lactonase YvrE
MPRANPVASADSRSKRPERRAASVLLFTPSKQLREIVMRKSLFTLVLLGTLGGAGCTSDSDKPPGGGGGIDVPPFTNGVSMLSGWSDAGYVDGERGVARLANPVNAACGPDGNVYVADFDNGKIRVVDADDGTTSTLIATTGFQRPFGMAFAPDGTLYVSTDRDPQGASGLMAGTIWRIDISARTATPIASRIGRPRGLAVLSDGRLAVADYAHHVIELFDPKSGAMAPLAGAWDMKGSADGIGATARFAVPYGLAVVNGALIVADFENHKLRKVALDGTVSAFAGTGVAGFGDGAVASAKFNRPQGLAVAGNGDLYVTDTDNFRVRRVRGGNVETIAGNGQPGYVDSDDRLASELYGLEGLCVERDGSKVYVADGSRGEDLPYNRVRSIKMN